MDSFVVDYLRSGKAWVLVGSDPSEAMGYPSWRDLAEVALFVLRDENPGKHVQEAEHALGLRDFPRVFECVWQHLGHERLLEALREKLKPKGKPDIYNLLAKWPVAVYMTTNWDDQIHDALVRLGESYISYTNSEAHMAFLCPEFRGGIVKLHGDLKDPNGLVMTSSQYQAICDGDEFEYWRVKLTSVFQMTRIVVIGHSLTDENVRHVLKIAKRGGGVERPVCWIAPNVQLNERKKYLNEMKIRVVSYHHEPGDNHANLIRLLEQISVFVPSRASVKIPRETAKWIADANSDDAAAPALFVYNSFHHIYDSDKLQSGCLFAALKSSLPVFLGRKFSIMDALVHAGVPVDCNLSSCVLNAVTHMCVEQRLLQETETPGVFVVITDSVSQISNQKKQFQHLEDRFKNALTLKARGLFPKLSQDRATDIAQDIRNALVGYFRSGGLTLATALFNEQRSMALPPCILEFINRASHQYDDLFLRQVFSHLSIDIFIHPTEPAREFLGRMAQGFFAFHSLGIIGEVAVERIRSARDSVWLLDSDALIQVLALNAPTWAAYTQCVQRLESADIRIFTLDSLADEAWRHFVFAKVVVEKNGEDSHHVWLAANGETPYDRSNQFLHGFVRWREKGGVGGWDGYIVDVFGVTTPTRPCMVSKLNSLGIELVGFQDWPGFSPERDYAEQQDYVRKITQQQCQWRDEQQDEKDGEANQKAVDKAQPEAEASVVVLRERAGDFNILSKDRARPHAWFISNTSILNSLVNGPRITWHPEAFLRFSDALPIVSENRDSGQSFEALLFSIAEAGVPLLAQEEIASVFHATIDQSTLILSQQHENFSKVIEEKYCEPPDKVLARVTPTARPLAALQLALEAFERQSERVVELVKDKQQTESKDKASRAKLKEVERFRQKMEAKKAKGKKEHRRQQSQNGSKKKLGAGR